MPADAWAAVVRSGLGREIPATEVVWMRVRELWIHTVDLDAGAAFSDFPVPLLGALLDEAADSFSARPECPSVQLISTDDGKTRNLGPAGGGGPEVSGSSAALTQWLLGRAGAGTGLTVDPEGDVPALPAWL